jgi:hypothetical protein
MGKANNALGQITAVLDQQSQALQQIQASGQNDLASNQSDAKALMSIKIQQAQLELQKDQAAFLKKISESQNKQIEALQKGNKDWKTVGDKFKDMKRNLQDALDPNTIKKAMLGPFSMFKGARDKMDRLDYVKQMKAQGDTRSSSELNKVAKQKQKDERTALKAQDEIDRLKKMGVSERDIKRNKPELFNKRDSALKSIDEARIVNPKEKSQKVLKEVEKPKTPKGLFTGDQPSAKLSKTPSDEGKVAQSTTDVLAEQQLKRENEAEMLRLTAGQMDLLQQIADNTAMAVGKRPSGSTGGADSTQPKGGLVKTLGGVGDSMKSLGSGLGAIGQGIGQAIGGVFKGIMIGISEGIQAFASAKTLAGVVVIGLITVAVWGMSKALENFSKLDWETIGKAGVVLGGLMAAGALAGNFAPMLLIGSVALAALGASVWVIGKAMDTMGDGLISFTDGLERLAAIDGMALAGVAAGLTALGVAMAAFGVGNAVSGVSNLVTGFLSAATGQKSPVDQLIAIGQVGPGVKDAADGIDKMSGALSAFGKVDPKSMSALKEFPWEQATKFAAAGGSMSVAGAKIYNQSKGNADEKAKVEGKAAASVVAPSTTTIQQNNNQTNVTKSPARNPESSYNRYLMSRF